MKKRYASLDVLRGLTVAFMCIVNNPGTWSHIFSPLRHAPWNGCTPTDLVFPTFVFCMGCAMAFSFEGRNTGTAKDYLRVLKRGALIFLTGLALNLYPFFPTEPHDPSASFGSNWLWWLEHKRIFGVLQRIGLSYILAGCLALWLRKPGKIMSAIGVLCVTYTGFLLAFGLGPGAVTRGGTAAGGVGGWRGGGGRGDGGGYLVGSMIIRSRNRLALDGDNPNNALKNSPDRVALRTFVYGCASLAGAMILSIAIPISKPLWSASYVFYAGGWAMLALAFLMYIIDIKGIEKPFTPFKVLGTNALMAFVVSGVLAKSWRFISFSPSEYFGANEFTSLLWAIIFMLIVFCILLVLYRKKIIIKL